MGFQFHKKFKLGKHAWINVGKKGLSGSFKIGPFTFNTKGRTTVNFGNGVKYVKNKKK